MPRSLAVGLIVSNLVAVAAAQQHDRCPMAASPEARRAQVDHRHDEASGVPHEGAQHHFLLAKDGGTILLEARDASDALARNLIRQHLQTVARSFAAGDYSLPKAIHDQVPPGAEVMKTRKDAIQFTYAPTAAGGGVRIATRDAVALAAIHDFLRFQIADHETNDPTQVR